MFKVASIFIIIFLLSNTFLLVFPIQAVGITSKKIIVPEDYSTIQEAIDAVEPDSVIYVKAGVYLEHIVINKPLWLIGEDSNKTIADGQKIGATLTIKASNVFIRGFTITGGGVIEGLLGQGIGIALYNAVNCTIINNRIIGNRMGIYLHSSSNINISNNIIMNNREGIYLYNSTHNSIIRNDIVENEYFAIHLFSSNNTQIIRNNMVNNSLSIYLYASSCNNTIIENNMIRSGDMIISTSLYNNISKNIFIGNSLYVLSSYKNIIKDNIVNDKPLVYLEERSDYVIKDAGQ
ncbi:MAG: NosD domain-containing protein, partial [Candidatus Anstonellales archaeon]